MIFERPLAGVLVLLFNKKSNKYFNASDENKIEVSLGYLSRFSLS